MSKPIPNSSDATAFRLDERLAADTHPLAELDLCSLRLMNDAQYPWLILVPRLADARELIDLPAPDRQRLSAEIDHASRALRSVFSPFKINVAALGNVVAQLHVHVIARFREDPAWPAPVWGHAPAIAYPPDQLAERLQRLTTALQS